MQLSPQAERTGKMSRQLFDLATPLCPGLGVYSDTTANNRPAVFTTEARWSANNPELQGDQKCPFEAGGLADIGHQAWHPTPPSSDTAPLSFSKSSLYPNPRIGP
ncbi:hypothetical protein D623_10032193 [Myotis brandtii]|uniref:Uncharacterized protein n=1 Tax=Myotis brandtii TaxID=109478 RepID=S7N2S1_MYOBR|nr:hypothetical protein D623_10032193 [Myotis brandtii]